MVPPWLQSAWNISYNHFLSRDDEKRLRDTASRLLEDLASPESWAASRLGEEGLWWSHDALSRTSMVLGHCGWWFIAGVWDQVR